MDDHTQRSGVGVGDWGLTGEDKDKGKDVQSV